jgi:hypothetical protein
MAYDYGKTPAAQRRSPAQGKHAKSGARALPTGRHAAANKSVAKATGIVAPEARPVIKASQKVQARKSRRSGLNLPTSDKRRTSPFRKVTSRAPALFAEFLVAVVIISISLFTETKDRGYQTVMAEVMMRLSALTAFFFVLFLLTSSKRGGEFAMYMGLLVDIGILYRAVQKGNLTNFTSAISGQGIEQGTPSLAADITEKPQEFHETPGLVNPNG